MSGDINDLARIAYDVGIDPIDYAEGQVKILIETHCTVATSRTVRPAAFPIYSPDLSIDALARRIIGNLLDAGWQPPAWPIPEPGASRD